MMLKRMVPTLLTSYRGSKRWAGGPLLAPSTLLSLTAAGFCVMLIVCWTHGSAMLPGVWSPWHVSIRSFHLSISIPSLCRVSERNSLEYILPVFQHIIPKCPSCAQRCYMLNRYLRHLGTKVSTALHRLRVGLVCKQNNAELSLGCKVSPTLTLLLKW